MLMNETGKQDTKIQRHYKTISTDYKTPYPGRVLEYQT